ncbi:signal peptidase I [Parabacteroides faecis]
MKIGKNILLLLFVCLFIRIAVGEPCFIPSESMEPTLLSGDRIWINKLAYGGKLPTRWADIPLFNVFTWIRPLRIADEQNEWKYHRLPGYTYPKLGDIVVFNSPSNPQLLLVKRIVQVIEKGDTLIINRNTLPLYRSLIIREDNKVSELKSHIIINGKHVSFYTPKQSFYFMEGDNHDNSHDSRIFGFIPEEAIIGKSDFVLFSLTPQKSFWKSIRWERILGQLR